MNILHTPQQEQLPTLQQQRQAQAKAFDPIDDRDSRKIIADFCHLLEKSKQLFNGLRDLPSYGHRQWQGYFGRTFDVFTKLWKFQQQHRQILDTKYGLKRWQIGDIASKIGQLYYHYYLRTSETSYLNEAFSFYAAIRARAYYSRIGKDDRSRSDLMVKKLRYYARFIVVCLLLKKMKLVRDLTRELAKHIEEYASLYDPEDHMEWTLVLSELKTFIEADGIVNVLDSDSNSIVLSHRLNPLITPPVERSPIMNLSIMEVIVVGSRNEQAKFSEITLDMFRILQTMEREPQEDLAQLYDASPVVTKSPLENGSNGVGTNSAQKRDNPHKYLLFKPTVAQFLVFLASGHRELPVNGALMIFISGDGCPNSSENKSSTDPGYDNGGVYLTSKKEPVDQINSLLVSNRLNHSHEQNCLYPSDLSPFCRRPVFLVVDSDNSIAFKAVRSCFDQPLVVLMSPTQIPVAYQDDSSKGSLYTLFLHSPLSAFCYVTNVVDIPIHLWDKCLAFIDRFMTEASRLVTRCRGVDPSFIPFLGDDFFRLLLCRHIFACVVLRVHRAFRDPSSDRFYPDSKPSLPVLDILENPTLQRYALDIATQLEVRFHFVQCGEID